MIEIREKLNDILSKFILIIKISKNKEDFLNNDINILESHN